MLSSVLASTAILRQHYRRLKTVGVLGSLTSLGLLPIALYGPRLEWVRYTLLALVCFYTARKIVQYARARNALKQLLMEEQFVRCGASGRHVRRCLKSSDHLWRKSFIFRALNTLATRPAAETLLTEERRTRAGHFYQRSFRGLIPLSPSLDHLTLTGIIVLMLATPLIPIDLTTLFFQAGFLALALAVLSQASQAAIVKALTAAFDRFTLSLCDWTLRLNLDLVETPESGAYKHHLLYRSDPWFASPHGAVITSGDGALREPKVSPPDP